MFYAACKKMKYKQLIYSCFWDYVEVSGPDLFMTNKILSMLAMLSKEA